MTWRFAHQTSENPLCPRVVHVCSECGWWKDKSFDCEHLRIVDGEELIKRVRSERCQFYLDGERAQEQTG